MLDEFYVVTLTSVYHVKAKDNDGYPSAVKIAAKGKSKVSVGQKLLNGDMVGICKFLTMYYPEKYGLLSPLTGIERRIEQVNTRFWGGHTSAIVALFLDRNSALKCLNLYNDLQPCDPRWLSDTQNVLREIGEEHPVFYIAQEPGLALVET